MTPAFRYALLWIAGCLVLVVAALTMLPGARLDGQYIPSNPDAFYHARRILDVVMTGEPVAQFDPRMHHPDGAWIPWPWGFDSAMALVVGWFGPFATEAAAASVLMNLVVAAAPLAIALLLLLARQLDLTFRSTVLVTLAFAALPLVFLSFAVGNVDHHFAELLWALLALCAGISFLRSTTSLVPAAVAGAVLGTAVAVHNGLFVLQLPLLMAGIFRWLRREPLPPRRSVLVLAIVLVAVTLCVSVPSEPWQRGVFEFYTLSWYHSYVAMCTGFLLVLLSSLGRRRQNVLVVAVAAILAALPVLGGAGLGAGFVSGELEQLRGVTEAFSPYELYTLFGPAQSTRLFSWLMWLALPALLLNAYWLFHTAEPGRQFFACAAVLFLTLMQLQYRFGVLGIAPLLATLALALDAAARRWPAHARMSASAAAIGLVVTLTPTRDVWTSARPAGGDPLYADVYPALLRLREACARRPGVVLAAINDGHWVRYHTECSVIGNVFLLTEQDARKRLEVETLLGKSPFAVVTERPDITYVLVHSELELFVPINADGSHGQGIIRWRSGTLPVLTRALLGPEGSLPPGYRVLWTGKTADGGVLGRLLELER